MRDKINFFQVPVKTQIISNLLMCIVLKITIKLVKDTIGDITGEGEEGKERFNIQTQNMKYFSIYIHISLLLATSSNWSYMYSSYVYNTCTILIIDYKRKVFLVLIINHALLLTILCET